MIDASYVIHCYMTLIDQHIYQLVRHDSVQAAHHAGKFDVTIFQDTNNTVFSEDTCWINLLR